MRRYRFPILILALILIALLYFTDLLTGRVYQEDQDPFSRIRRIRQERWGFRSEDIVPTSMSEYVYGILNVPRSYRWEPSGKSFRVERLTGRVERFTETVPPIQYLEPDVELAFLLALPNDQVRRAVLRSLYQSRRKENTPEAKAWNERLAARERDRANLILTWHKLDRNSRSMGFTQWWNENASVFGLKPDGTTL